MSEKGSAASSERLSLIEQIANALFILGLLVIFLGSGNSAMNSGRVLILAGVLGILGTLLAKHENWHTITERLLIIGMIVGVVGMFQANSVLLYEYGFYILGLCTLGFIVILHIPKPEEA